VVTALAVTPTSLGLAFGSAGALSVTATYDDGTTTNVTGQAAITSDRPWIASASGGLVTAGQLSGIARLSVSLEGVSVTVPVLVAPAVPTAITFTTPPTALAVGRSQKLTVTATLSDGTTRDATDGVAFTTSDDTRATIDDVGVANGVAPGPVGLTARLGALTATVNVTVTGAALSSLAVSLSPTAVYAGGASQATAVGTYADGSVVDLSRDVTLASANQNVAIVEGATGTIRSVAQGTASITAALTGVTSPGVTLTVAERVVLRVSSSNKHTLALWSDDGVSAWGMNDDSQLGQVSGDVGTPVDVGGLPRIRVVEAGGRSSYAVDESGRLFAFGRNGDGELGRDAFTPASSATPAVVVGPFDAPEMERVVSVKAGYAHVLVLDEDGFVYTFGLNSEGQLGLGDTASRARPERIAGLPRIARIAAGAFHSLAIDDDGRVWSWGDNATWQQANGTTTDVTQPALIAGLGTVVAFDVAGGWGHTLLLSSQGNIYGWGWNTSAQLGIGNQVDQPVPVFIISNAVAIATTYTASGAIGSNGITATWGSNAFGQLGINSLTAGSLVALTVVSTNGAGALPNVVVLEGGADHFVALDSTVGSYAWGRNAEHGQVGDGSFVDRRFPVALPALMP
jgi:alpha-tubulin suppressor-like RCC1 family protein